VRKIVQANYDRARKAVMDNLDKLKLLAEALLEFETVDGVEIDTIFAGGRLDRKPSTWASTSTFPKAADKPKPAADKSRPSIFAPPRPMPDPEKA
jgi:cell division protease FtsH